MDQRTKPLPRLEPLPPSPELKEQGDAAEAIGLRSQQHVDHAAQAQDGEGLDATC
jgi:hypothetical protein